MNHFMSWMEVLISSLKEDWPEGDLLGASPIREAVCF